MDTSVTVKPRDSASRTKVERGNIVRTDLSPGQSVNAARSASPAHHTPGRAPRDPSLDPQCNAVLDREREERQRRKRAREDDAMLRRRAYGHPQAATQAVTDDGGVSAHHADFEI